MTLPGIAECLRGLAVEYAPLLKGLALASAAFFIITPLAAPAFVVLMPADALVRSKVPIRERPPFKRAGFLLWHILKNLLGAVLMVLGFVLLFVPGQGLLTMFAGVLLADFPGRRALLARLLGTGRIRPAVDRLRARRGKAALLYPGEPPRDHREGGRDGAADEER